MVNAFLTVKDSNGAPIVGATVSVVGISVSATTDNAGLAQINLTHVLSLNGGASSFQLRIQASGFVT